MKNIPEKVQDQNAIAISVLHHLLSSLALKAVIHKFGSALTKNILQSLIQKLESLDAIDEKSKQTIVHLMLHHSDKGRQYDGLSMETSRERPNRVNRTNKDWEGILEIKGCLTTTYTFN